MAIPSGLILASHSRIHTRQALLGVVLILASALSLLAGRWESVDKADLESKASSTYPGVAAEDLFMYQTLDASSMRTWTGNYLRRKVYNAKAAEDAGVLNIEYDESRPVSAMAARLVKRSGAIVELPGKSFTDTVALKTSGLKIKAKTLAVPNLEAGDIVEYQWEEAVTDENFHPQIWMVQSAYPTKIYTFTIRKSPVECQVLYFNLANAKTSFVQGNKTLTATNLPPYEDEPLSPPERDLRGTVMLVNTGPWARWWGKDDFWKDLSTEWAEQFRSQVKPNAELKRIAGEVTANAANDNEKIARLYNYVRKELWNLNYFDGQDLQLARKTLEKKDQVISAAETLKLKSGYPFQINKVFAALCIAAGYEVRCDWSTSRKFTTNVAHAQGFLFLEYGMIAVKITGNWKLYSPGDYFVPAGLIDWQYENAPGLVCEDNLKKIDLTAPQAAPASASEVHRVGKFSLNTEGDCEGTVTLSYTGHSAIEKKHVWANRERNELEKQVREEVSASLPSAELSDVTFENTDGMKEPTIVSYKMKIPGYAEAAGDRLILAPSVFQKGAQPLFKAAKRKWPISFPYAQRTNDEVFLTLPEGYELESPSAPQNFGGPDGPFRCQYRLAYRGKERLLTYRRDLIVADKGDLTFPATSYDAIKRVFDGLLTNDNHTLVLKPKETGTKTPEATSGTKSAGKS